MASLFSLWRRTSVVAAGTVGVDPQYLRDNPIIRAAVGPRRTMQSRRSGAKWRNCSAPA